MTEKATEDGLLDIAALIRSIQRAEGNPDCYRRGIHDCDRWDCSWRRHCLNSPKSSGAEAP